MALVEEAIASRLLGDAGVGAEAGDRIFPYQDIPQSPTYPVVTFQQASLVEQPRASGSDPAVATKRFQFDCWAEDYTAAKNTGEAVRKSLQRWSGTEAGVVIQGSFLIDERDLFDETVRVWYVQLDFDITHER